CDMAISWFAPFLLANPPASIANTVKITDDGEVVKDGSKFRQITYRTVEPAKDTATSNRLMEYTRVEVFYDPQTLLPASTEYFVHADKDLGVRIPVRVVYGNYQAVSGTPIPFQIDRYVNGVLQLSVVLTNASLN